MIKAFIEGFKKGARETHRAYFAPAIAIWRLLITTTDSLTEQRFTCKLHTRSGDELPKNPR